MASRTQSPDSSRPKIVALPSLASSLSSLPQAKSMAHVALHPNMYGQRAVESEAKLQRALTKNASHETQNTPSPVYNLPPRPESPNNLNSPLMMREPQRPKFST
ncbi:hypothetical protein PC9H_009016 [Pleurotus ostreatus]|uniref:Uncharacterized protein n=1 Tax=Pleurotus ostreatus TaxID=5322 RepID=A0A8H6ZQP8_PLEOS|nr:uncharacterized protein PC9H_010293 [Pleurotus ostreatus]XP_036629951.1 uncharacterized protein PC9H_009016 [Pleurotus ostreatus]KAF7424982.1 hypothetical protein PC9H_010293 [Pleurotus ostreatus]KAF7426647.1 hypothetical protein PC9H_009016 [Pleurotus ostreatus]KAJ8694232.1 hypothetical protein PTI98_009158 [Pleurotus ostreatus]KAJ8694507.1 hypothetical protein PTI98_007171 [Pleurotus ostreatus]